MRRLLKPRYYGVPVVLVAALLVLVLTAGSVFAAFTFLNFTTQITVAEPLTVEYNLNGAYGGDSAWHPLGDQDSLTLDRSAGDDFDMSLRITNIADNPLTVNTVISGIGVGYFTASGFPDGTSNNAPVGVSPVFTTSFDVHGDAPPDVYSITFSFKRS